MSTAGSGRNPHTPHDPIGPYLATLRASLRIAPGEAELIVAEAEDHLRETVSAGLAAGMTEREAQEAAISAFGSVRAVVRAHDSTPGYLVTGRSVTAVLGDMFLAAWKLAGLGLIAVGASGLVVALMNVTLGRVFTGQAPPGVRFPKADCAYWMRLWPTAPTCGAAHMLEASSDAVVLRFGAGIVGVALFEAYVIVHYLTRRRGHGPAVLLAGYFPLLATCVFGAGALSLGLAQLTGFTVSQGPGSYLSGAIVAAAVALAYGVRARSAIGHLMRRWASYAGAGR
jgi:hypothetical protein